MSEDFPERVTKIRTLLWPFMKTKIDLGTKAYLRYDKLVVEGVTYSYDYEQNNLSFRQDRQMAEALIVTE